MSRTVNVVITAMVTLLAAASAAASGGPSGTIAGTVMLTAADGDTFPAGGARVTLACTSEGSTRTEISDEHGAFRFLNVPVANCSIEADVQGFVAPPVMVVAAADGMVVTDLHLGTAPLRAGVIVGGTPSVQETKIPCRFRGPGAGRRLAWSRKECSR